MIRFINGPAANIALTLTRTPMFLRVVNSGPVGRDPKTGEPLGDWDALDRLDDMPQPGERVHVYIIKGQPGFVHVDGRDKKTGKRYGITYPTAEYELFHSQPADDIVRDNTKWGEWATETGMKIVKERADASN